MRKFILLFLITFSFNNSYTQEYYSNQSIEDILKLPENKINVGIASLVFAKEFYPNLNIFFFLKTFDYLADRYKYYFGKYTSPEDRIRALNTYLYKPGFWNNSISFSYDNDDLQVTKLDNKFINGYIANKKGSCITMPMLYVILGERLGFPIYPVRSAKHFFVRYIPEESNKKLLENIETTNGGGFISDEQYKEDVLIPDKAIKNGVYLRTLSKKEYIASLLLINANEYIKQREIEKAKHYFQLAIKYDSTFSSAYWNYGLTAFGEAKELEKKMWEEKQNVIGENEFFAESINKKANYEFYSPRQNNNAQSKSNNILTIPQLLPNDFPNESLSKIKIEHPKMKNQIDNKSLHQSELQLELMEIESKYQPIIMEKIKVYKEYSQKAEQLGIVHEFPIRFFEKQIESINKFKRHGGY